ETADFLAGFEQPVESAERVVGACAKEETDRLIKITYLCRRWRQWAYDLLEWAVEAVEHAVELHAHLIGQRPAGNVIRRGWGGAGIRKIVRVVLRLEHVEHVGTKRLGTLHDIGAGPIMFAGNV